MFVYIKAPSTYERKNLSTSGFDWTVPLTKLGVNALQNPD